MKKIDLNNSYFKIGFCAFVVFASLVLFEKLIGNLDLIFNCCGTSAGFLLRVLEPFIFGFFIAYFLNPAVNWFVDKLFFKIKISTEHKKSLAITLTYIIFIGSLVWIFIYLIPEITLSVQKFILIFPSAMSHLNNGHYGILYQIIDTYNSTFHKNYSVSDLVDLISAPFVKSMKSLPEITDGILSKTFGFASSLLNFFLGLVISIYLLCDKEKFCYTIKKLLFILFGQHKTKKIILLCSDCNEVLQKFIIGKSVDSLIIGILFFIICSFINLPYLVLLSFIIAITNMIPYFGPLIGAVPVIFIVLINSPIMAIWVAIIIFCLQQFDGIILGPKILGDSTGLRPIEVIFAITAGGAFFGLFGMFFGVPVFSVIMRILKGIVNKKYSELDIK